MKKKKCKLICLILTVVCLFCVTPVILLAANTLSASPNAKVEYSYSATVNTGTIRYVQQNAGTYWSANYWSPYGSGTSSGECYSACVSMALSYVGVNHTAGEIVLGGRKWAQSGASVEQVSSVSAAIDRYINGNGKYSPVVIWIPYTSGNHWVLVAGRVEGNTYLIVDPWNGAHGTTWQATVVGNSISYWGGTQSIGTKLQYYNGSAVLGRNPFGSLDSCSGGNGTIYISGWVADWDDPGAALGVHVYVGGPAGSGAPGYAITANKYRPDVNNVYSGIGDNHGFEDVIQVSPRGNQTLYIYGLNVGGGDNILIGTANVTINEPVHKYWLDINGMLDGKEDGGLKNYGTCDVYINGELKADDCNDFYSTNGTWEHGSTYEIKDIKATKCHKYEGVYSGSLSGTLNDNISVSLKFTTAHDYEVKTVNTTCTVLGYKTYTCKNCGDTYTKKDTELLPHDYQKEDIKATCVNPAGIKYTCKNCGYTYTEYASADWSDWSETYPEGIDEKLIESRTEYSYSDKQTTTSENSSLSGWMQTGSEPVYSEWGGWSSWQTEPITSSETVNVASEKVYRYYYFYCPVCGGREPFQGTSDCHQYTLTLSDSHVGWFTLPYSQSNPQAYSYTTAKVYTTAPDGSRWNFSKSNVNDTAIGTLDDGNGAVVITTGYRSRTRTRIGTKYYYEKWGEWSDWSATKIVESSTRHVKTRTAYRYNRTPYGEHNYEEDNISNNTITYKCVNCNKTQKMPMITINDNSGILTVKLAATNKIIAQGIIYGEESTVTLETSGRVRVAYSKVDSNRCYSFDTTKLTGCAIRAYVIYMDQNGNEQVIYSDPYVR